MGLFTQLGQMGVTQGLTGLPAARATALSYAQVVFAALWGWLFFAETIELRTLIGALAVMGATLLSQPPMGPQPGRRSPGRGSG
jgi:drug/metabolite transporter (DMT)-like permease